MTMTDEGLRLKCRGGGSQLNEHDSGGSHGDGRRGVHGDAKRAVVCGVDVGMEVSDLDDSQKRQQDQAQDGNDRPSRGLGAAIRVGMGLKWRQTTVLYPKDTQNWTYEGRKGFPQATLAGMKPMTGNRQPQRLWFV